jgi:hypothetical protein
MFEGASRQRLDKLIEQGKDPFKDPLYRALNKAKRGQAKRMTPEEKKAFNKFMGWNKKKKKNKGQCP